MRLTRSVVLTDPAGESVRTACHPLTIRGDLAEQDGIQIPLGSLQLVVDEAVGADTDWRVDFRGLRYGISAIIPYLKRRIPQRVVLICSPESAGV